MLSTSKPTLLGIVWARDAAGAYVRSIPFTSQIGVVAGAASWPDGFVPKNFQDRLSAGGVAPSGKDFNGAMKAVSQAIQWTQVGGLPYFNATMATQIGGYPKNCVLQGTNGSSRWRSTVENNMTDPDGGSPSGWVDESAFGVNIAAATSISAIRGLSKVLYSKVITSGFASHNDGGGGVMYLYDSTDTTSSDDGVFTIVATDSGRWKMVTTSGLVMSRTVGCKHDNSTNDTAAHNLALAYCQAHGLQYVVSPGGQSLITQLTITAAPAQPCVVSGMGPASVLKQIIGENGPAILIGGTTGGEVQIRSLYFDGQQSSQAGLSIDDAIKSTATGASNGTPFFLSVSNCDFINTAYRGIAFYGDNDNSTREIGRFEGNRFREGSINATNTAYSPIDIHLVDGVEATVHDNEFSFANAPTLTGGAGRSAVVVAQTQTTTTYYTRPVITNNRIRYRGVNEAASLGAIDLYIWSGNATVENNIIVNSTASAIKLKGNSYNMSIINNKIDGMYMTGGALTFTPAITVSNPNYGVSANQFLISLNQISNWNSSTSGVISVATYDGTSFSKNVSVTFNQISNCSGLAIDVNNCQDVEVFGNQIDGQGNITTGIRVLQCDGMVRIQKNKIANTSLYHIYNDTPLTATQDALVEDNTCIGTTSTTYSIYLHCRQAIARKNTVSGGYHGINFGGGVQSAIGQENLFMNMTGTVGIAITSTAVNVIMTDNQILDSASITTSAFANSSTPTFMVERSNSWNGQSRYAAGAPSGGTITYAVGDRTILKAPTGGAGNVTEYECTTAGAPGTHSTIKFS